LHLFRQFDTRQSNKLTFESQITHFHFNFWLNLYLFWIFKTRKSNQSTFESRIAHFQFNFWLNLHLFRRFETRQSNKSTFDNKSQIFNSISDCICIYFDNSKQENQINQLLTINRTFSIQFLIEFAFIRKIQNKKIKSINFWATNQTFKIRFLIDFAFISKIQNKKI
jgi:hypothetical protein